MSKSVRYFCFYAFIMLMILLFAGCSYSLESKSAAEGLKTNPTSLVIHVKNGDDIQEVINQAKDGSEIIIAAGRYLVNKPVEVNERKNLSIIGQGEVWVESEKTDHQIFLILNSSNILLKNIKAQHIFDKLKAKNQKPLDDNRKGSVVDVENSGKVSFDNCELVGCGIYGIFAGNTEKIDITNCYLHHNSLKALCFINTKGETNVLIKDSRIINNADFIQKEGTININMDQNNIIENNNPEAYLDR